MTDTILAYGLLLLSLGLAYLIGLVHGAGVGERRGKQQACDVIRDQLGQLAAVINPERRA